MDTPSIVHKLTEPDATEQSTELLRSPGRFPIRAEIHVLQPPGLTFGSLLNLNHGTKTSPHHKGHPHQMKVVAHETTELVPETSNGEKTAVPETSNEQQ